MKPAPSAEADPSDRWYPTLAHVRAVATAIVVAVAAVLWRRPDLLVLAGPFAVVAAWSVLDRPVGRPVLRHGMDDHTIREGATTVWRAEVTGADGMEMVVAAMPPMRWVDRRPSSGVATASAHDGAAEAVIVLRSARWGRRMVEPVQVVATSTWAGFRWADRTSAEPLTTLPVPEAFDATAMFRPSDGLVGVNRSVRSGEGAEFASIRRFQSGDRMRRINWARSTRVGSLQVNATWADQDTHVMVVVDAASEVGVSEGVAGRASGLDTTVRAAAAIARHYGQRGERVSLRVLGSTKVPTIAPASGQAHLQRVLEALSFIQPTTSTRSGSGLDPRLLHSTDRVFAILLSPLLTTDALDGAVAMTRHGTTVAVVDTLPSDLGYSDPDTEMAWRVRLLERHRELRVVQEVGIPVVAWDGPGSLDRVLRDLSRRATAPRMRRR